MNLHDILELDFAYLDTFTKRTDTWWGYCFCNESQPIYFDANHAHIDSKNENPQQIIDVAVHFYQSRNLIPRFYLYDLAAQQNLIDLLKLNQFGYEELNGPVQLWIKS